MKMIRFKDNIEAIIVLCIFMYIGVPDPLLGVVQLFMLIPTSILLFVDTFFHE